MRDKTKEVELLRKQLQELQDTEQHQEEQSSASTLLVRDGAHSSSSSSSSSGKIREGEAAQADKVIRADPGGLPHILDLQSCHLPESQLS